jgi:aminoglycoside phosphotransferase (APT) family kinase protein
MVASVADFARALEPSVRDIVRQVLPDAAVLSVAPLRPDTDAQQATHKAVGYGAPLVVAVRRATGAEEKLVVHFDTPNDFGHDRRADRAANVLLAWDDFPKVPGHVRALDVGILMPGHELRSLRDGGELYLLTPWVPGEPYAEDLRRIGQRREAAVVDLQRCAALVDALVAIHACPGTHPAAYARAIRDLLGHGEGIFGLVDAFSTNVPAAPPERLEAIEQRCLAWRWRLKARTERLRRTHGDFHPWNVVFGQGPEPALLDSSRGSQGDPADDVTCMALNYVFFALLEPAAWKGGYRPLWRLFWARYLERTRDRGVLETAAPFLAWRALVMSNPSWYPAVDAGTRDALLRFVERALEAPRFDPDWADALF